MLDSLGYFLIAFFLQRGIYSLARDDGYPPLVMTAYVACRSKTCAILKHVSDWHGVPFWKMCISATCFRLAGWNQGQTTICIFLLIAFELALRFINEKQTNKQTHKQTNKKQANTQTNKQKTSKHTNKQNAAWSYFWSLCTIFYAQGPWI